MGGQMGGSQLLPLPGKFFYCIFFIFYFFFGALNNKSAWICHMRETNFLQSLLTL